MAAGHIVQGECVPVAAAQPLILSYLEPGSSQQGADSYTWWFSAASSTTINKTTFRNGTFFQNEVLQFPNGPTCDTAEKFKDGQTLGWGVVAAMVAAFAIHILRRGLT